MNPLLLRYAPHLAAGAAVLAGLLAGYRYAYSNGVAAERARWEAATAEAGERFAAALADQQVTITKLDRDLTAARRKADRAREDLADALNDDPAALDWSRVPVPDGVRDALGDRRGLPADPGRPD